MLRRLREMIYVMHHPQCVVYQTELESKVLTDSTAEAAMNCLMALANDGREPERYRQWYANAYVEMNSKYGKDQK